MTGRDDPRNTELAATFEAVLADPARLRSLAETGLGAEPDPAMDAIAARVRRLLRVPIALVSLVTPADQVFPGMTGLRDPWASARRTPLSHSLCQHVVASNEPLVVADARADERVRDSLALSEIGVVGYTGFPLTDAHGSALGSLCAIDTEPREWTADELDVLAALADGCSARLRVLIASRDADRERDAADAAHTALRAALDRSQLLLNASEALNAATDVAGIRERVTTLVSGDLKPLHVGLLLSEDVEGLLHPGDRPHAVEAAAGAERHVLDTPLPAALTARDDALMLFPDAESIARVFPAATRAVYEDLGVRSLACAPLRGVSGVSGVLLLGWGDEHAVDLIEQVVITTLARYVTHALERVRFLQHRIGVARELQQAMLTTLPPTPGLVMAARYLPAARDEQVGGDWYDAIPLSPSGVGDLLAVAVGDITGHDIHAATVMGQVRAMARQATWERPAGPPSAILLALEDACRAVGLDATGTLLHAHLRPLTDGTGRWLMRWANAGHPPPIVLHSPGSAGADGFGSHDGAAGGGAAVTVLHGSDLLFGFPELRTAAPRDRELVLWPGDTVLLYTDGLVERRGSDILTDVTDLGDRLARLPADPRALVERLVSDVGRELDDDVVALALRVPPAVDGPTLGSTW